MKVSNVGRLHALVSVGSVDDVVDDMVRLLSGTDDTELDRVVVLVLSKAGA